MERETARIEPPAKLIEKRIARYTQAVSRRHTEKEIEPPRVITISRDIGAGGTEIAAELGRQLNIEVWDRQILDVLASESYDHYRREMFTALDESSQNAIDELVGNFFSAPGTHDYLHLLPKAILTIAQHDAIIVGRGSHLLLPRSFRVRIGASHRTRRQNLMAARSISKNEADALIQSSDHERSRFIRALLHNRGISEERTDFDLGLNTDRIGPAAAVEIVIATMRALAA